MVVLQTTTKSSKIAIDRTSRQEDDEFTNNGGVMEIIIQLFLMALVAVIALASLFLVVGFFGCVAWASYLAVK